MSDSLDPGLAHALQEPARMVRADPGQLEAVRRAGTPAQAELMRRASDAASVEDRYAAAAMLAALFNHRGPLDQAAHGYGGTPPTELLDLADVPALRPALRQTLSSPVRTGLLEWATTADPARPPLELAMAARDLGLDDAAVLRSVADRADQVARQDTSGAHRGPLVRFSEVLRQAADAEPEGAVPGDAASSSARPAAQEPTFASGPAVTTTGIPAAELLDDDERDAPATGSRYPGEGVPVRDSIAGPGGIGTYDTPRFPQPDSDPRAADDDAARPGTAPGGGWGGGDRPGPDSYGPGGPPRQPSTNDLYYGAGSERWADRDPNSEESRAEDRHAGRNLAIVFAVIVAIIVVLVMVL
ncbi:hypothetical protein CWC38_06105 [Kocuria tytonicola]|uniref:hypothetical protein n=1 Tax=Kocuria tytonicola TaxID=2055946 RepID=UPI000EF86073|nr:hypothetical protein [Kocuria tytonicola]RLZ03353.1 hypothetical protein CWC38_06105 [Kocuria tytonicola]